MKRRPIWVTNGVSLEAAAAAGVVDLRNGLKTNNSDQKKKEKEWTVATTTKNREKEAEAKDS